ncbi:MAG: LysM peptidoglycan-binding domain-containing protein, partial [Anaerolineae bacterium]|nr:LysM peptidoglycan-binding domain-containing protein [Anaerolineae bacterium]
VATSTPHPDGTIIHVVQPDDTFYAIALLYDVSPEQLVRLNGLTDINMLSIGQELLISAPESPASPAAQSTPLPPATATPTWAAPTMATPTPASIPSGAMALSAPTTATSSPTATTPEAKNAALPWGLVGGIGLLLGFGAGFVVGKMQR